MTLPLSLSSVDDPTNPEQRHPKIDVATAVGNTENATAGFEGDDVLSVGCEHEHGGLMCCFRYLLWFLVHLLYVCRYESNPNLRQFTT